MENIKTAIILAAGKGNRLKPLTDEVPKPMVEVNGKSILEQDLEALSDLGLQEVIIVIGYLGDYIKRKIGDRFLGMKITYVVNSRYGETNSMYSLWLARDFLRKGCYLIEGDVIFDRSLLTGLSATDNKNSFWAANTFNENFDGCMLIADKFKRVTGLEIVGEKNEENFTDSYKSAGILKITSEYGKLLSTWLSKGVKQGNENFFYDLIIKDNLSKFPIYIFKIDSYRWMEIDNAIDLRKGEKIFLPTKYIVLVIDGAGDKKLKQLGSRSPIEFSNTPTLDYISNNGLSGLVQTMYSGLPTGSDVANMGLLGYNPYRYHPKGRASFEAIGQGIDINEGDLTFRCNLISIFDLKIKDFTSKNIQDGHAKFLMKKLKLPSKNIEIYPGQSYRNLLVLRDANMSAADIISYEPHSNIGGKVTKLLLRSVSGSGRNVVRTLNRFILDSIEQIKKLNQEYRTTADMIFLWSPSDLPNLPPFSTKFGLSCGIVSGLDFLKGIGHCACCVVANTKGATGYSNTNLKEKYKETVKILKFNDLVYVHVNAPDEESHIGNTEGKVKIIEKIDRELITPLLSYLKSNYEDNFRIVVLPDHYTYLETRKHGTEPVPFSIYGKGIVADDINFFSESLIESRPSVKLNSYDFIEYIKNL